MSSSEHFSWTDPESKKDKTKKTSSSKPVYLNAPVGSPPVSEHVDITKSAERDVDLHPRVLPAPLFEQLVSGEKENKKDKSEPEHKPAKQEPSPSSDNFNKEVHLPAETPIEYDLFTRSGEHDKDESAEEEDEDSEDDEEDKPSTPKVATPKPVGDSIAHLEHALKEAQEEAEEPSGADEAAATPEPFIYSESEPSLLEDPAENSRDDTAPSPAPSPHEYEPLAEPVAAGGGGLPPRPPVPPRPFGGGYAPMPGPVPESPAADFAADPYSPYSHAFEPRVFNTAPAGPSINLEDHKMSMRQAEYNSERVGLRRGLVAGFITGYIVKQYLAGRKQRRFEQEAATQLEQRDRQIAALQSSQAELSGQIHAQTQQSEQSAPYAPNLQPQAYAAPEQAAARPLQPQEQASQYYEAPLQPTSQQRPEAAAATAPIQKPEQKPQVQPEAMQEQTVVGQPGEQQVALQPGQRLERRGWYSVVVDEHGREVQGAINYGEAMQGEQRQEHAPPDQGIQDSSSLAGGGAYVGANSTPMLPSGQADMAHELPPGHPLRADASHSLPASNKIKSTVTSPVLWLAVALIVIAYLIAALI